MTREWEKCFSAGKHVLVEPSCCSYSMMVSSVLAFTFPHRPAEQPALSALVAVPAPSGYGCLVFKPLSVQTHYNFRGAKQWCF